MALHINNLSVFADVKQILKNITLSIQPGELHVVMGPNGSGKSTLANALMGHPKYRIEGGSIVVDDNDITHEKTNTRAKAGLFLSMQYPPSVDGVSVVNLLRHAVESLTGTKQHPIVFFTQLKQHAQELGISESFLGRSVNMGFSGGEKKRMEMLQLAVLQPSYAILDETDSGLDVDALKTVAKTINSFHGSGKGVLLITHYNRILEYLKPDFVHIMIDGNIVKSGTKDLAVEIEKNGYDFLK